MDRCDFSSIMTCLKNHISESNQMNQPEFLYEVFEDFMDSPESKDFSFDNGLVCRWMTGQAKISPKISTYYAKPSKQEKLAETIHQNLLPLMTDCSKALQDVYTLFMDRRRFALNFSLLAFSVAASSLVLKTSRSITVADSERIAINILLS